MREINDWLLSAISNRPEVRESHSLYVYIYIIEQLFKSFAHNYMISNIPVQYK